MSGMRVKCACDGETEYGWDVYSRADLRLGPLVRVGVRRRCKVRVGVRAWA